MKLTAGSYVWTVKNCKMAVDFMIPSTVHLIYLLHTCVYRYRQEINQLTLRSLPWRITDAHARRRPLQMSQPRTRSDLVDSWLEQTDLTPTCTSGPNHGQQSSEDLYLICADAAERKGPLHDSAEVDGTGNQQDGGNWCASCLCSDLP